MIIYNLRRSLCIKVGRVSGLSNLYIAPLLCRNFTYGIYTIDYSCRGGHVIYWLSLTSQVMSSRRGELALLTLQHS